MLLDPDNWEYALESRCHHVYKLRYSLLHNVLPLIVASYDLPVNMTSESIDFNTSVLLDLENVGMAVEISLLSYIQTEIYDNVYALPVNDGYV